MRERLELFVPICHAVQHAHQKGIIHRDIHPYLVSDAEGGTGADGALWLLPLSSADDVSWSQGRCEAVQARIPRTLAAEETELLDEELLGLLATGRQ
jgi:hypothetical protein